MADNAARANSRETAMERRGDSAIPMSNAFDGRWVNTIVRKSPKRTPSRAATGNDSVYRMPAMKKTTPSVPLDAPKRAVNQ